MAGDKLYVGEMIEAVNAKLDSVMTSMASQVAKMDEQIAALNAVNTSVGQSVSSGNLTAGITNSLILNQADISTNSTTPVLAASCKIFGKGKVKISAEITSSDNYVVRIYYSINGAANVEFGNTNTTGYVLKTVDINVNALDEVKFYIVSMSTSWTATIKALSLKVQYNVVNLVTEGYVVKV